MAPVVRPQIKVVHGFDGRDYVCERSHHNNVTIKRHYPVDYGS